MNRTSLSVATAAASPAKHRIFRHGLLSIWTYRALRWLLAIAFIGSGISKLSDPQSFAVIIEAYGLLPGPLVGLMALALPTLELVAGIGLAFDIRGSLALITILMGLFIAILGYGLYLGLDVDCGCFGPEDPESEAFHGLRTALYRDLIMLAGIGYLYFWRYARALFPVRMSKICVYQFKNKEDL